MKNPSREPVFLKGGPLKLAMVVAWVAVMWFVSSLAWTATFPSQ